MAIGRLQAALASATSEVTVAAANINFDFTLVKCEAPKEYQVLGNVLSTKRKENAEFGSSHVLARQLGALFDGVCPPTPALLEAYGIRASEIAKVSKDSSKPFAETLFGDYTGIDGTSIWAAATSSKSALHIHLLACLLARVWSAPEAVAIWVELVSERKKEIARKVDEGEPVPFALAAAVGQDVSRPQLAALDNSARAWLRTADDIFYRQQKQLDLILRNLDVSIPGGPAVFPSVIQTWKIALETMNNLVAGIPQAVQDGAALLGLSSWHLYPNMSIYSSGFVEVRMEDPNVAEGGILSLGVSRRPNSSNLESGVHWSLSLSQLRHYGRPVKLTRDLETSARLSWAQFSLVLFAALVEILALEETRQQVVPLFLTSVLQYSDSKNKHFMRILKLLKDGGHAYANRMCGDRDLNHKLIQLGRRRSRGFLSTGNSDSTAKKLPPFGLFDFTIFLSAFKDVDSAVTYFRHVAERLSNDNTCTDFLIGHRINNHAFGRRYMGRRSRFLGRASLSDDSYAVMTAIAPTTQGGAHRAPHHRRLPANCGDLPVPGRETSSRDILTKFGCRDTYLRVVSADHTENHVYLPVLGSTGATALFARRLPGNEHIFDSAPTIEDFQWCLDHDLLHPETLLRELNQAWETEQNDVTKAIRLLGTAALIYDDLPNATIDANILRRPLGSTKWFRHFQLGLFRHAEVLSMISYFETGIHDIDPDLLENAIAVSHADSFYVPSTLIQDPYESAAKREFVSFRRILGNIGKPGLNFLLPPQEPMMREIDTDSWRLDSYHHFDGTMSQSFQNTSMHLSFTDYHAPIFHGARGSFDNQVFFIESVISVQDKGDWIADVDPLPLILNGTSGDKGQFMRRGPASCQHNMNSYSGQDITAVDTWNELLDAPAGMFVVRAGNNWVPRLAAALVAYQRVRSQSLDAFPITVCPPEVCWTCTKKNEEVGLNDVSFPARAYIF